MKKKESLQILRAVAALLVVHIHAIFMVELNAVPRQVNFFNLAGFGACGVDIFFAISGFILSTVAMTTKPGPPKFTHNAWDFLFRRFIRIFPIYWFLTLFFVALAIKQHHLTVPLLVNSYLLLPSLSFPMPAPVIFVGWTLIFEMFFYYLITLNLFWGNYRSVERTIITILALIALGFAVGIRRPILILIANPINMEFVFGCLIGLAYARFGKRQTLGTVLLVTGALLLVSTLFVGNPGMGDNKSVLSGIQCWSRVAVWGVPAAMITAGLAFRSTPVRSSLGRLGVRLGDASYSIYLISLIVFFVYDRIYAWSTRLLVPLGPDINVVLSILVVAVIGLLCYRYVESPMTRFITAKYKNLSQPIVALK